jgi:hypothetical protein
MKRHNIFPRLKKIHTLFSKNLSTEKELKNNQNNHQSSCKILLSF